MPAAYGDPVTCWRRFVRLEASGAWERIWATLLRTMDPMAQQVWTLAFLDLRQIPTKPGRKYGAWASQFASA